MQHALNRSLRDTGGKRVSRIYSVSAGERRRYFTTLAAALRLSYQLAAVSRTSVRVTLAIHRSFRPLTRKTLVRLLNGDDPDFCPRSARALPAIDDGEKLMVCEGLVEGQLNPFSEPARYLTVVKQQGFAP